MYAVNPEQLIEAAQRLLQECEEQPEPTRTQLQLLSAEYQRQAVEALSPANDNEPRMAGAADEANPRRADG